MAPSRVRLTFLSARQMLSSRSVDKGVQFTAPRVPEPAVELSLGVICVEVLKDGDGPTKDVQIDSSCWGQGESQEKDHQCCTALNPKP
eukprot:3548004-Amphidinium_carterae.1